MSIDIDILKEDFKLQTVVQKQNKIISPQGRETYGTKTVQVLIALYDKGIKKEIQPNKSTKKVSIIDGYSSPLAINLDDEITSYSNLTYKVIEIKQLETLIYLKAISYV